MGVPDNDIYPERATRDHAKHVVGHLQSGEPVTGRPKLCPFEFLDRGLIEQPPKVSRGALGVGDAERYRGHRSIPSDVVASLISIRHVRASRRNFCRSALFERGHAAPASSASRTLRRYRLADLAWSPACVPKESWWDIKVYKPSPITTPLRTTRRRSPDLSQQPTPPDGVYIRIPQGPTPTTTYATTYARESTGTHGDLATSRPCEKPAGKGQTGPDGGPESPGAARYESEGRKFESCRARQVKPATRG